MPPGNRSWSRSSPATPCGAGCAGSAKNSPERCWTTKANCHSQQRTRSGGRCSGQDHRLFLGARLAEIRALVPQISVFGASAGGRTLSGQLQAGRLIPHLAETSHLTGRPGPSVFEAIQLESYTRVDELATSSFQALTAVDDANDQGSGADRGPIVWRVETFPAGMRFASWIRLDHATDLQAAFTADVLDEFCRNGYLGGRSSIGHGQIEADFDRRDHPRPAVAANWREHLRRHRTEALNALRLLT